MDPWFQSLISFCDVTATSMVNCCGTSSMHSKIRLAHANKNLRSRSADALGTPYHESSYSTSLVQECPPSVSRIYTHTPSFSVGRVGGEGSGASQDDYEAHTGSSANHDQRDGATREAAGRYIYIRNSHQQQAAKPPPHLVLQPQPQPWQPIDAQGGVSGSAFRCSYGARSASASSAAKRPGDAAVRQTHFRRRRRRSTSANRRAAPRGSAGALRPVLPRRRAAAARRRSR
jgi:hypothetical protein